MRQYLRDLVSLIKCRQTFLLLFTGLVGYASGVKGVEGPTQYGGLLGSLFLAIGGVTVLNMLHDRDIDSMMERTENRPLVTGRLSPWVAVVIGVLMSDLGLIWAFRLNRLYGLVVTTGWLVDMLIYTLWLKRRSPWSIFWGGVAGGTPALAGRVLATGRIELVGLLLAVAVLLWIPTHIMTFHIKHAEDYARAGLPIFPNVYGVKATHMGIGLSTLLAAAVMMWLAWRLTASWGLMAVVTVLSMVLVGLAANLLVDPSSQRGACLFRFATIYITAAFGLLLV